MTRRDARFVSLVALCTGALAMLPATVSAQKQILRLRLDGPVIEAPVPNAELIALFGGTPPKSLREIVRKIE